ncbi:WAS/WASL-interacting protein family member 3 [Drosophila yakuba]|uniref:WAS/WASL-interacting protein family member 3 n=1 Tax=Drosophila yakuba TaxID=7245 RepID=UPI00193088F7|nr:WAS/WASL-interacting protein family member 3 [Drosophila yakuba]
MAGSVRAPLLGLLLQILILCNGLAAQQLLLPRPQRSLFEAPLGHLGHVEQVEHLPSLGWNSVGAGLGLGGGEWGYSPVGLGHMSKDELLTLLEAWKEVEQESATTTTAPPADSTTRRPATPPPPPPPPPPRPIPIPVSIAMPAPALPSFPQPPSGTPITVRLPAFVPVRLAAVFTPPAGGQAGTGTGAAPPADGVGEAEGADLATEDAPDDDVSTRLFRFMPMPGARTRPPSNLQPKQQFVVRNTLDSVDAGTAPVRQQVKPEVQPKATAPPAPLSIPKLPSHPTPFFRPRFGVPPSLANARFELVPSSQIIGDWRE